MKYLLIVDRDNYINRIIKKIFEENNHQFDIINIDDSNITKINLNQYVTIIFGIVSKTSRVKHINLFNNYQGKIITIKLNTNLEYCYPIIKHTIYYGIPNEIFYLNNYSHINLPPKIKTNYFNCPITSYNAWEKPNYLSKMEFMQKYKLENNKKICLFLPGRIDKITNCRNKLVTQTTNIFFQNFSCIIDILKKNNYHIILKYHTNKKKLFQIPNETDITIIDQNDNYEAFKYSHRAMTINSSIAYETYLYDLPIIDFGIGSYFFQWGTKPNFLVHPHNKIMMKKYNDGKDLIYGYHFSQNDWSNLEQIFTNFLNKEYRITDFLYRSDHPIYGKAYYFQPIDLYHIILKQTPILGQTTNIKTNT